LYSILANVVKEWSVVCRCCCLIVLAICNKIGGKGSMLWFDRSRMSITGKLLHDILGNGEVDITFFIMPKEVNATVDIANLVFNNVVGFLA
jgi:hypothetical protein